MGSRIELAVTCGTSEIMNEIDTDGFDSFYLGNPFCLKIRGNLLSDLEALKVAIRLLKKDRKKVYLTTPVIPTASDFKLIDNLLQLGVNENVDGVEVHDVGALRLAKKYPLKLHLSVFGNVYNRLSALKFHSLGVKRIVPSLELTLAEIAELKAIPSLELEISVHGKLPLGIASACLLGTPRDSKNEKSINACHHACLEENFLLLEGLKIRTKGTATFTGADLVMIEHLPLILRQGYKHFRVEGLWETAQNLSKIGQIYKEAFEEAPQGKSDPKMNLDKIREITSEFCNGWYFGRSGREYVSTIKSQAPNDQTKSCKLQVPSHKLSS